MDTVEKLTKQLADLARVALEEKARVTRENERLRGRVKRLQAQLEEVEK